MDIEIKQQKRLPWLRIAGAVGLAGVIAAASAGWLKPGQPSVPHDEVRLAEVELGRFVLDVNVSGTLVPRDIRWLGSRTGGRVEAVRVEPGETVAAGDIIMELSEPELVRARDEASWRLSAEEANAAELEVRLAEEALEQRMRVAEAEAAHESARLELEAERELAEQKIVSRIRLRQSELETAKLAQRVRMEAERTTLWERSENARRDAQAARVRQLADVLAALERRVEDLVLRSPIDGVVDALETLPGESVPAGARIARVVSPLDLIARVRVPEFQAGRIAAGQVALVRIGSLEIPASVTRIDPAVVGGTVEVDLVTAEALPSSARPDLTISARINIAEESDAVTVQRPLNARESTQIGLFRLRAGSQLAERVPVEVGRIGADRIEVVSGLEPGDRIIISDTRPYVSFDSITISNPGEAS
ncbi:MAG: HlyD family efflux transporter periplasmic adaptor subunit [Pseudomonadota bacterium]